MVRTQLVTGIMVLVLVATVAIVTRSIVEGVPTETEDDRTPPVIEPVTPDPSADEAEDDADPDNELEGPTIEHVQLDGQDLADLMNIRAWRFNYHLPEDEYTVHVWLERWTREADEPEVQLLLNQTLEMAAGRVVLRLPTEQQPTLFVRVGDAVTRAPERDPLELPTPLRREVLERQAVDFDAPVHLITFTHNASEPTIGGLEDVHRDHDFTLYVKVRFFRGPNVPFDPRFTGRN